MIKILPFNINDFSFTDYFRDEKSRLYYLYTCICGESGKIRSDRLSKCNGKCNHYPIGSKWGRLTVTGIDEESTNKNARHATFLFCDCECGTKNISVISTHLKNGHTKSCGCYNKEINYLKNKKYNKFEEKNDYYIGYTENYDNFGRNYFLIDKDDYEKIKDIRWRFSSSGYVCSQSRVDGIILLHRLVMNAKNHFEYVDHIMGDESKNDNRKCNLRLATPSQNVMNAKLRTNNVSGFTGVFFDKHSNKWRSVITYLGNVIHLGSYSDKEDAIKARVEAENKYFGEWSYSNSRNMIDGKI